MLSTPKAQAPPKVIGLNSSGQLAQDVAAALGTPPCKARVGQFANGEVDIKVLENVRGEDVFVIASTCQTDAIGVNTSVMELLLMIHTLKLASARRIVAIMPHYGYARQDRKTQSRVPISAAAVAKMITEMGCDNVVTVDLHCGQIEGFFHHCPVANLNPAHEFAEYARKKDFDMAKTAVVAPDAGAVTRAKALADRIGAAHVVTILKRRVEAGKVEEMQLVGEVKDFRCIIVDDMIDTGGTLVKAANVLKENGAMEVYAFATHGILTDPASERINACDALVEVVVTDSLPQQKRQTQCPKIKVISMAALLAEAITRIHTGQSMEQIREVPVTDTTAPSPAVGGVSPPRDLMSSPVATDVDDLKHFPR